MKANKLWFYILKTDGKSILINDTFEEANKIPFSTRSSGYKTKDELIKGCEILEEPCKECGNHIRISFYEPIKSRLIKETLCFNCDFWTEKLNLISNDRVYVVDGQMYNRADDIPNGSGFQGFGGSLFKIKRFGQDTIIESKNMWYNGRIPEHFKNRIKDNAEFIK